jgi:hypothetical protein
VSVGGGPCRRRRCTFVTSRFRIRGRGLGDRITSTHGHISRPQPVLSLRMAKGAGASKISRRQNCRPWLARLRWGAVGTTRGLPSLCPSVIRPTAHALRPPSMCLSEREREREREGTRACERRVGESARTLSHAPEGAERGVTMTGISGRRGWRILHGTTCQEPVETNLRTNPRFRGSKQGCL